jgi:hypothetical protein
MNKKPNAKNQAGLDLLQRWREEDAAMTEEEKDQADRDFEEFKRNMNETRRMEGREPVFPQTFEEAKKGTFEQYSEALKRFAEN